MKHSTLLASVFALVIAVSLAAPSASAAEDISCRKIKIRCRDNYSAVCQPDGEWTCVVESKAPTSKCIAVCPDGYHYPTCDANGREMFIYGDPCKNHESYGSSDSFSCSGPNPLTCTRGTVAACTDNTWVCESPNKAPPTEGKVVITSVSPRKTQTGKQLVITGKGFSPRNNTVIFADSIIPNVGSTNGKTLNFRIPATTTRPCYLTKEAPCKAAIHTYTGGTYAVWVKSGNAISNALTVILSGH